MPGRWTNGGGTSQQRPYGAEPRQGDQSRRPRAVRRFDPPQLETRLTLEAELALAAERDEFELFYQPQFHLADGRLIGAEALIRWRHPVRGLVSPAGIHAGRQHVSDFRADRGWVLQTACARGAAWERAGHRLRIGVDTFAVPVESGDLAISVAQVLASTGLSPTSLELEVTEDILLHDEQGALKTFLEMRTNHSPRLRRFRHRIRQLGLSEEIPARRAEDRPLFRIGLADRCRRRGDRQFDHRA